METLQRKGGGVLIAPSQITRPSEASQIPRPSEKYSRDLRVCDANVQLNTKNEKEKGVSVQVILRCRPLSEEEQSLGMLAVITCNEMRREVLAIQNIGNKQTDRTFVFDKVFGQASQQTDLFNQSIAPIVDEVLEGFSCTVFAYGQTGTGKTYTMEGGKKAKNGEFPSDAGVIPRSVRKIFESLEAQCADYMMKVSFLELYNEEITDLLAPDESKSSDDKSKKPLALMEDGKGGVFVRGLEEEVVCSASEIYMILDKGSAKRRTAETLLNKQSSRSHSIFCITIHIKEVTSEGEELVKVGKLNLVDLAGSENILRSGAREGRAREAGEINKSLLTLGRVINALVEHTGHIPYRESKLTRLLRDSLGGKSKTCIIATISPSIQCLEETLSTLDYAHRAKNIKNKPEVNQKMMKSVVIKDLCVEIDRLRQEVNAAREKNGIYIPRDHFKQEEAQKKARAEKLESMELELESKDKQLLGLQELYDSKQHLSVQLKERLDNVQKKMKDNENMVVDLEEKCQKAKCTIREKEYLIMNLLHSERALAEHAHDLRTELNNAAEDISGLCYKIEHKDKIEERNRITLQKFQSQLTQQLHSLHKIVLTSAMQQENQLKKMEEEMQSFASAKALATTELIAWVDKLRALYGYGITSLDALGGELDQNSRLAFGKLYSQVLTNSSSLDECFQSISFEAENLLTELQSKLSDQEVKLNAFAQLQREGHIRTVEVAHSISNTTTTFFHTLDVHVSKLNKILEDTQTSQYQQLNELEKNFQECAANEEEQLLEKVAEMLASSNDRKKKLAPSTNETGEPSRQNTTPEIVMDDGGAPAAAPAAPPTPAVPEPNDLAAIIARAVAIALLEFRNGLPAADPAPVPVPAARDLGMDRYLRNFRNLQPTNFNGEETPMQTDDWLIKTRDLLEVMQCPENKKVPLAAFLLTGEANLWWTRHLADDPAGRTADMFSWNDFSTALSTWFVPPSERRSLQEKYLRLFQGDKTVIAYERELTHLSRYAGIMQGDEDEKCSRFVDGLRDSLRQPLMTMVNADYRSLVDTARKLEADQQKVQKRNNFRSKRTQDAPQQQQHQNKNNHGKNWNKKQRSDDKKGGQTESKVKDYPLCSKCYRHHLGECLAAAGVCYKCHQPGHIARYCQGTPVVQSKFEVGGPSRTDKGKTHVGSEEKGTAGRGPVQPRAYGLGQQEAKDQEDVVTGVTGGVLRLG